MYETAPRYVTERVKYALIVGGTRGIGKALTERLIEMGWGVYSTGRKDFDISMPRTWKQWGGVHEDMQFDLVVFCAGDLRPYTWSRKNLAEYLHSYAVHAAGPACFLAWGKERGMFPWWTKVVFVSTVGAINAGAVDLSYGAAKAALEKMAKALDEYEAWQVFLVRLDLVNTRMLLQLPTDTLHGRPVLEPEDAAEIILREAGEI